MGPLYSQTQEGWGEDKSKAVLESINLSPEVEKRMANAFAAFEKMVQAGRYISSITELLNDREIPLPVGLKSSNYTISIEELYSDSVATGQNTYIRAVCIIPTFGGKSLAFEGRARIEGENGVGTLGTLELIAPIEKKLGNESSIIFREGTSLTFGCEGFHEVNANVAFVFKSDKIFSISNSGQNTGKLMFDTQTKFSNINDFTVSINSNQSFCFRDLEGFVFTLNNLVLDHSIYSTPVTVNFPDGYFSGGDFEESQKNWQGLAIAQASVLLPSYISNNKNDDAQNRISLDLHNVLIDGSGFSGAAESKNVISESSIDPKSWAISVNDFRLAICRNTFCGIGFGGKVNIPPLGKNSLRDYVANYDVEQKNFVLQSSLGKDIDFPMLCAKLKLDETSTISLSVKEGGVYPTINASGYMSLNVPIGKDSTKSALVLPDLRFEGMEIGRDKFEMGTFALAGKLETPTMAGFKLTLSDINTIKSSEGQGLSFKAAVKVNEIFNGDAGFVLYGNSKTWDFNKVKIDRVHVKYESGAFSINGGVEFREGDGVYGDGFRGDLEFELIKKFTFNAVGVFGHKDDYRYFLTDVFYETQPASGIHVPPALSFYGLGGGLYHHMQQELSSAKSQFGESLTGINYVPDKKVGMGFLARTKFGLIGSTSLFDAEVNFEMQFNSNWGVNFIQLRGDATMLSMPQQSSMIEGIKKGLEKIETRNGNIVKFDKTSLDVTPEKDGALSATVGMMFDMEHDVFTADMNAYLNVAGILKGRGKNNSMGWANAYFANDKWYTYIGTPSGRLGVTLLGIADAGGYFMVGSDVPELPGIPNNVKSCLSPAYVSKLQNRTEDNRLSRGKGLAFGADMSVNLNAELMPFYAKLGIGMGTEMLLKQYSADAHCKGRTGSIGINGWYAQAQAWAWVGADIGMMVKLFKKTHRYSIINAAMASYLKGAGPNPIYFTGAAGGRFSILGGLISGNCNFDFTIGEKCEIVGGSPFGEDVIEQITPADKSSDVDVFIAPQLVLNIPANERMEIEEDNGKTEIYRIAISEFSVSDVETGAPKKYSVRSSDDNRVWTYKMEEPLENHRQYKAYAKVVFERQEGDNWVAVLNDDNEPYYEEKSIEFSSGERPDYILPEHIVHAYPADRQFNFLTKEHDSVYFITSENYSYLFNHNENFYQEAHLTAFNGRTIKLPFTTTTDVKAENGVFEVDIPTANADIKNNEIYKLSIVNVPRHVASENENIEMRTTDMTVEGESDVDISKLTATSDLSIAEQTEIYAIDFKTSQYKTLSEKINHISIGKANIWQERGLVYSVIANVEDNSAKAEAFDLTEYSNDVNASLIKIFPDYAHTPYYSNKVAPLIYENSDVETLVGNYEAPMTGKVISLNMNAKKLRLEENDIETGIHSDYISPYGAIVNNMQHYINADYNEMLTKLVNILTYNNNRTEGVKKLLKLDNIPFIEHGHYPVIMRYTLPGINKVTSEHTVDLIY